ncbi:MAG TPA: hypothetical protein VHC22_15525 [Pirellulales bacterium]|nr:hypothetical protein [Pirellulales bacterium]
MHDQLLGYLLGALEPSEQEEVETRLLEDAQLQDALERLREKLALLDDGCEGGGADGDGYFEPPSGLAARTCKYVATRAAVTPKAPACGLSPLGGWRVQDMIVGGGVFLAACMLIFPAIAHSLSSARITSCQNNLRAIGLAMGAYSDFHGGQFPFVPERGPLAVAGVYGPVLVDLRLIEGPTLVCPTSPLADQGSEFVVPHLVQVVEASAADLARLQSRMGGSYGYTLGYYVDGRYRGHHNQGRAQFALMADAPGEPTGLHSVNHGGAGQNVLFEDLHVAWLKQCRLTGCGDHIYVNGLGYVGAGIDANDAVIGHSSARPVTFQVAPAE